MREEIKNIIESIIRIYDKRLEEQKIDTAVSINLLLKQAEENKWDIQYINAIKDIKKTLRITGTIYDLYE